MDNRAQISAEYLIVMAAVLAVALILVVALRNTSSNAKSGLPSRSNNTLAEIRKIK